MPLGETEMEGEGRREKEKKGSGRRRKEGGGGRETERGGMRKEEREKKCGNQSRGVKIGEHTNSCEQL